MTKGVTKPAKEKKKPKQDKKEKKVSDYRQSVKK